MLEEMSTRQQGRQKQDRSSQINHFLFQVMWHRLHCESWYAPRINYYVYSVCVFKATSLASA